MKTKIFNILLVLALLVTALGMNFHDAKASAQPSATLHNADKWYETGGGECDDHHNNSHGINVVITNMFGGGNNDDDRGHGHDCDDDGDDDNNNDENSNDSNSNDDDDSNNNDDDDNNSNDDPEPQVCTDSAANNNGGPLPCTYDVVVVPPVIIDYEVEDGDAPRQIKKINKPTFIIPVTGGDYCSVCFTGFVYKADQETDLNSWIKKASADDLGFTIQIGFQADDWYEEVIEYGIAENASFILTWYEIGDKEWITSAVDILKAAGVTCFTFAFDANEDPSWIDEAKQISIDLVK